MAKFSHNLTKENWPSILCVDQYETLGLKGERGNVMTLDSSTLCIAVGLASNKRQSEYKLLVFIYRYIYGQGVEQEKTLAGLSRLDQKGRAHLKSRKKSRRAFIWIGNRKALMLTLDRPINE